MSSVKPCERLTKPSAKKSVMESFVSRILKILFLTSSITLISCSAARKEMSSVEKRTIEKDIEAAADDLALAISQLDAAEVTNLFGNVDGAKYISDGAFISQKELKEKLGGFYGTLQEMNFTFEKKEVRVLSPDVVVLTSWAHYRAVAKEGQRLDERAIFTSIYTRDNGKWRIFQAHKSLID